MQPRSPALHRTNPWCLAVVCMIGTLTHVHIGHCTGLIFVCSRYRR